MLDKLSPAQEALIAPTRDYWVNLSLHSGLRVERAQIEDYLTDLYKSCKLKKPNIIVMDSFTSEKFLIGLLLSENQVRNQVENQVWNQVGNQVENQVRNQVGNQVENQVRNQVWNQVRNQVGNQVGNQVENQVWNQKLEFINHGYGLGYWAGWFGFYDYFQKIGVVKHKPYDEWRDYISAGVWNTDWFENFVILTRLPTKTLLDERGRLHSLDAGAVQWADGLDNHFIHGVGFDQPIWRSVAKREISAKAAITLPNAEQRTVACTVLGYDTIIKELNAKKVDKLVRNSLHYSLYEIDLKDDRVPAKFIQVECATTGKETILRVDPQVKHCDEAVAWTFNLPVADYGSLKVET
jgi:hypothetical protein